MIVKEFLRKAHKGKEKEGKKNQKPQAWTSSGYYFNKEKWGKRLGRRMEKNKQTHKM